MGVIHSVGDKLAGLMNNPLPEGGWTTSCAPRATTR